jgi:Icc-related predicted phosphoesterase
MNCFFVSDLHGKIDQYQKLFDGIADRKPDAVFLGGDLTESGLGTLANKAYNDHAFFKDFLAGGFSRLKEKLGKDYPGVFIILGNDDLRTDEQDLETAENQGLWHYINLKMHRYKGFDIYGYAFIPPSPFLLKDFEKYDVSQYVDPGCVPPEEGFFSTEVNKALLKRDTIKKDLERIAQDLNPSKSIMLFHSPPYQTKLDRAALDGKFYNHVPLDVHIGSIAIRDFIINSQPLITLHGHVHESARLTGSWKEQMGQTLAMSAAHDGDELCLVVFDPTEPGQASRQLL